MDKTNKVSPVIPTLFLTEPEAETQKGSEEIKTSPKPIPLILQEDKKRQKQSGAGAIDHTISPVSQDSLLDLSAAGTGSDISIVSPEEFYHQEKRLKWFSPMDSLIICIAFSVGFSNIETFPRNCITHGGAAYVFAYTIILFICVIPIAYLEMAMGQFVQQGCLGVWKLIPLLRGGAYIITFLNLGFILLFSVYNTWILAFLDSAVAESQKWAICQNEWNSEYCVDFSIPEKAESSFANIQNQTGRFVMEEFYRSRILKEKFIGRNETQYSLAKLGAVDPKLSIFLVVTYLAILLSLGFGHRFQAKIAYFTVGIPIFILAVILFRSMTISGAYLGVEYFFETNDIESLFKFRLWKDACLQALFSTGIGTSGYITIGSYNKFKHPILPDIIKAFLIDEFVSIFAAITLYSLLGAMSLRVHHNVNEVTSIGITKITYQLFPDIISRVPGSKHFLIMFYVMMCMNIWDTFMVTVEVLITSICDANAKFFRLHKYARMTIVFILVSITCIIGFGLVTPGGVYLIAVFESGFSGLTQAVCSLFFIISFVSVFGIEGVIHSIQAMNPNTNRWTLIYFEICWAIIIPLFMGYIMIFEWFYETAPEWYGVRVPEFWVWIATTIKFGPIIFIPAIAIVVFARIDGANFKIKLLLAISPLHEHAEIRETGQCVRSKCIQCCFVAHWFRPILDKAFENKVKKIDEVGIKEEDEEDPGGLVALEQAENQKTQLYVGSASAISPNLKTSSLSLAIPDSKTSASGHNKRNRRRGRLGSPKNLQDENDD